MGNHELSAASKHDDFKREHAEKCNVVEELKALYGSSEEVAQQCWNASQDEKSRANATKLGVTLFNEELTLAQFLNNSMRS